jgi:hypothetical protein
MYRYNPPMLPAFFLVALTLPMQPAPSLDSATASRFADLALACVHKEFPNKVAHVLNGDADVRPPRELTPAFYGCYDWHSSVHGHWLLARLARTFPDAPFAALARAALAKSLTPANIAGEVAYLKGVGRVSFERPYGLAWLLQLGVELREWGQPAKELVAAIAPLENEAVARITDWLPKLTAPIRIGEHNQTAFSFGLMLDWARASGHKPFEALLISRSRDFYLKDRSCPLNYEPSGEDFLSPCLGEADLMRRVLPTDEFAQWLTAFLPSIPADGRGNWLAPGVVTDPTDPKLAHLDGLNLSRTWMLDGIAHALPGSDPRRASLVASAHVHRDASLKNVTGEHYEGGHWLGTFAVYLVTRRGV